jgi:hypothetical protein
MSIGAPGSGLPLPQNPFPTLIPGISGSVWSNQFYLLAGQRMQLWPGTFMILCGVVTAVQFLDPVSGLWVPVVSPSRQYFINSDGTNYRISNLSNTLVGATVTAAGSGYVQVSTTVTPTTGISTWTPIIGGAVGTPVIGSDKFGNVGGTNFTYAPVLVIQSPPPGGIQATASCTVAAGAIATVTVRNAGAGYTAAPGWLIVPDPDDPTLGLITLPTITAPLTGAGTLTGVQLVNPGLPVTAAPTLTVGGAGTAATATATLSAATPSTADTVTVQWIGGIG